MHARAVESGRSPLAGPLPSVLAALGVLLVLLPQLATAPLSGDGAEVVTVAHQGGVLHAPGFPLQGWVQRLFALLPLPEPATRLALLSLLGHAGTALFVAEGARRLGASWPARVFAALSYAFCPPVWGLAVRPEVFALAHLLIAATLWAVLGLTEDGARRRRVGAAVLIGALGGLAAAQHTITVTVAPALIVACVLLSVSPAGGSRPAERAPNVTRPLALLGTASALASLLYLSLLWQRGDVLWPDAGKLETPIDVVRHMLRKDYGTFRLFAEEATRTTTALVQVARELSWTWSFLVVLGLVGATALARGSRADRGAVVVVASALLGGLWLLVAARGADGAGLVYLERFAGPALVPLSVFAARGLDALGAPLPSSRAQRAIGIAGVLLVALLALSRYEAHDTSEDRSMTLLQRGVGLGLPEGALYLSERDIEVFGGALTGPGGASTDAGPRFPVAAGFLKLDWYAQRVLPALVPELRGATLETPRVPGKDPRVEALVRWAYARGIPVVSTSRELLDDDERNLALRGLVWVAHRSLVDEVDAETVRAAIALCPLVAELEPGAVSRNGFSVEAFVLFSRAFDAARAALEIAGDAERARLARQVAEAIARGEDAAAWRRGCAALTRSAGGA